MSGFIISTKIRTTPCCGRCLHSGPTVLTEGGDGEEGHDKEMHQISANRSQSQNTSLF